MEKRSARSISQSDKQLSREGRFICELLTSLSRWHRFSSNCSRGLEVLLRYVWKLTGVLAGGTADQKRATSFFLDNIGSVGFFPQDGEWAATQFDLFILFLGGGAWNHIVTYCLRARFWRSAAVVNYRNPASSGPARRVLLAIFRHQRGVSHF